MALYCLPLKAAVLIGGEVKGVITAITIRPAYLDAVAVLYECEWWDGRDVKNETFSAFQVQPIGDVRPAQIGFLSGSDD